MFKIKNLYLVLCVIIFVFFVSLQTSRAQTATESARPTNNPANLREKIRADVDAKIQNIKTNQETRNQIIEKTRVSSTTPKIPFQNKIEQKVEKRIEQRVENRIEDRLIKCPNSTNPNEKCFRPEIKPNEREGYEDNGRSMQIKLLKERKEVAAKQLNIAIKNLEELRKRVSSRMEKDRLINADMGAISELIKTADTKLVLAKEAVAKLRSYEPIATSTTATTTVNLVRVRELIDNAQGAIKEAHRALTDVVVAIAKISGVNKDKISTSTPARKIAPISSPMSTTAPSPVTSIQPSTN